MGCTHSAVDVAYLHHRLCGKIVCIFCYCIVVCTDVELSERTAKSNTDSIVAIHYKTCAAEESVAGLVVAYCTVVINIHSCSCRNKLIGSALCCSPEYHLVGIPIYKIQLDSPN